MGQNAPLLNIVLIINDYYFLKEFVYLKNNVILPYIKWIVHIADYVEIWKIGKNIDL